MRGNRSAVNPVAPSATSGIVERKCRVSGHRTEQHRTTVVGRRVRPFPILLVVGRHEQHAVEPLRQTGGFCDEQMGVVDGIERPAEKSRFSRVGKLVRSDAHGIPFDRAELAQFLFDAHTFELPFENAPSIPRNRSSSSRRAARCVRRRVRTRRRSRAPTRRPSAGCSAMRRRRRVDLRAPARARSRPKARKPSPKRRRPSPRSKPRTSPKRSRSSLNRSCASGRSILLRARTIGLSSKLAFHAESSRSIVVLSSTISSIDLAPSSKCNSTRVRST